MSSGWTDLPKEIRLLVLQLLMRDGCTLSHLATVSRDWQTEIERYNFARIKVTPSRLVDFSSMVYRNRALVNYIWFCLEVEDDDCSKCASYCRMLSDEKWQETFSIVDADGCPIATAFENLFPILSTWDLNGDLVSHFFEIEPSWEWPNLKSVVLTSDLVAPEKDPIEIGVLLLKQWRRRQRLSKCHAWKQWRFGTENRGWRPSSSTKCSTKHRSGHYLESNMEIDHGN